MPQIHFVGEIKNCQVEAQTISISWAIVPGNFSWFLKEGLSFGETHTHSISHLHNTPNNEGNILNFPLDLHYDVTSIEGWPFFVCEVWDRKYTDYRSFIGCGSVWLPQSGANKDIDIVLWKPTSQGLEKLTEYMLPSLPDLQALRELIICPYTRSEVHTSSVGTVTLSLSVFNEGLKENGVFI